MVFLSQVAFSRNPPRSWSRIVARQISPVLFALRSLFAGAPRRLGSGKTESRTALDAAPRWFYARQSPGRLNAAYRMCWEQAQGDCRQPFSRVGGSPTLPHVLFSHLFWGTRNSRSDLFARAGYQQKHNLYRTISPWPSLDLHATSSPRTTRGLLESATLAHAKARHFIPQATLDRPVPTLLVPRRLDPTVLFGRCRRHCLDEAEPENLYAAEGRMYKKGKSFMSSGGREPRVARPR